MRSYTSIKFACYLLLFLSFSAALHAADTLYFAGNIIISKQVSYGYVLRFAVGAQGQLTGYSLTDAKGPNETKTRIIGTYDSAHRTIKYEETNVLRSKVDLNKNDLNFVHATLAFKHSKLIETLTGKFTAMQPGQTSPGVEGEIKLINTNKAKRILKKIEDNMPPPTDPPVAATNPNPSPDGFIKVFTAKPTELPFTGSNVKFIIWDNGKVDGDRISITLNGRYILENYTLDSVGRIIEMELPNTEADTIKVIALNEGSLPPNTATVRIESKTEQYPIELQAKLNEVRTIYLHRRKQQ